MKSDVPANKQDLQPMKRKITEDIGMLFRDAPEMINEGFDRIESGPSVY